jgi:gliding motility-associated protein GldL
MALSKKAMNFAYGMGAAVVIVGALFKIIHFELGPLTGQECLHWTLTEAFIFALSAFEPVDNELDWSLYPELATGVKGPETKGGNVRFARNVIPKIRCYVKDAK